MPTGLFTLNRLALLNLALVIGHQVDAAYWREWEMFGLPGDIQLFAVLNVLIFAGLLACLVPILARSPAGFYCSLAIATCSGAILPIHASFALAGFDQFHLPVSILLILATFLTSVAQAALTVKTRDEFL